MPNITFEQRFKPMTVLPGVHFYLFDLTKEEVSPDETYLEFNGNRIDLNIASDEQLLAILKQIIALHANRGVVLELNIFFYGAKSGLLPEFSKVGDKALEEITSTIQNFRTYGVAPKEKPKPRRKGNASKT